LAVLFSGKSPQLIDELSSDTSSSCDLESLQLAVERERSFKLDRSALLSRAVVEGDVAEKDEDNQNAWYTLCDLKISIRKQGNSH